MSIAFAKCIRLLLAQYVDMLRKDQLCYPSIRHSIYGDVINVRDCVLLRPDIDKSDVSYVAKVGAFWEHPKSSESFIGMDCVSGLPTCQ